MFARCALGEGAQGGSKNGAPKKIRVYPLSLGGGKKGCDFSVFVFVSKGATMGFLKLFVSALCTQGRGTGDENCLLKTFVFCPVCLAEQTWGAYNLSSVPGAQGGRGGAKMNHPKRLIFVQGAPGSNNGVPETINVCSLCVPLCPGGQQ